MRISKKSEFIKKNGLQTTTKTRIRLSSAKKPAVGVCTSIIHKFSQNSLTPNETLVQMLYLIFNVVLFLILYKEHDFNQPA